MAMVDNSSWRSLCFNNTSLLQVSQILKCLNDFIFANISVLLFKDPQVFLAALLPAAFMSNHNEYALSTFIVMWEYYCLACVLVRKAV